jgi:hypothetical protein
VAEKRSIDVDLQWIHDAMRNLAAHSEVARELKQAGWDYVSSAAGPTDRFCRTVVDGGAFDKDVEGAERIVGKCLAKGFPYALSGERVAAAPPSSDPEERLALDTAHGILGSWLVTLADPADV